MTTLPTWLVVVLGLAAPTVAMVALIANELRDRRRLRHEQEMQHLRFEDRRMSALRESRLSVYSTLARLTKYIEPTPPQDSVVDLYEILSEIELLTEDEELLETAAALVSAAGLARMAAWRLYDNRGTQVDVDNASNNVTQHRMEFIRVAKEELRQRPATGPSSRSRPELGE